MGAMATVRDPSLPSPTDPLAVVAEATGAEPADLAALTAEGAEQVFAPGAWLFHESTPRRWLGFVTAGTVELVRGLHGEERVMAAVGPGEVLGAGLLFDDGAHLDSARTRTGATVLAVPRAAVEALCRERPDAYYRVVARVARALGERLRLLDDRLVGAGVAGGGPGRGPRRHHLGGGGGPGGGPPGGAQPPG